MLDELKNLLPADAGKIGGTALIYGAFRYINRTVSADIRLRIALWMLGSDAHPRWHYYIPKVFTGLFGDKIFSWKAFRVTASIALLIGMLINLTVFFSSSNVIRVLYTELPIWGWVALPSFLLVYNFPFEHVSLTKTRWLMNLAYHRPDSIRRFLLLLCADLTLALVIAACSSIMLYWAWDWVSFGLFRLFGPSSFVTTVKLGYYEGRVTSVLPFVHSFWIAVSVLVLLLSRTFIWVSRRVPILTRFLNEDRVEREPITLIGEITAAAYLLSVVVF